MNAIEISNLSKTYTKGLRTKVHALSELNLEIGKGEIFGFLGHNGAGKSTTIKLILDILRPTSGKVSLNGRDVSDPLSRTKVGYLPENPSFYEYLTPEELLSFVGQTHGISKALIKERTDKLIKEMNLSKFRSVPIRYFSKGMTQKVGIIQALVHDPDILIFDEPSSGLDPIGRRQVTEILLSLKEKGKTIFFSSHILHDVEVVSDRVGIITRGTLRFCGKLSEVISHSFENYEIKIEKVDKEVLEALTKEKIQFKEEGNLSYSVTVDKDRLWNVLTILRERATLFSIEPKRKTLEETFLELADLKS